MQSKVVNTAVLLLLTACAQPSMRVPSATPQEISREEETQRSLAAQKEIESQARAGKIRLKNQERLLKISDRIQRAAQPICSALSKKPSLCVYRFTLLEEGPANAAADGEEISITPSMMRIANKDDELAYILAHEFAHNVFGHPDSQKQNAILGGLLGAVLDGAAGYNGANTNGGFADLGMKAGIRSYSIDFEREADYVGLYIAQAAGYNVANAPELWRKMSAKDPDNIYVATTHPTNPDRYVAMQKTVAEIRGKVAHKEALLPNRLEAGSKSAAPVRRRASGRSITHE